MNKIGQPRLGHGQLGRQWRTRISNRSLLQLADQKNKLIIMSSILKISTSLYLHLVINRFRFQGHQLTGHRECILRTRTLSALNHLHMDIILSDLQFHLFISRRYLLVILLFQVIFTWHIRFACEPCVLYAAMELNFSWILRSGFLSLIPNSPFGVSLNYNWRLLLL